MNPKVYPFERMMKIETLPNSTKCKKFLLFSEMFRRKMEDFLKIAAQVAVSVHLTQLD
jgi:hypothetical protein